jgi:8-oxo-dGTP pyrophosphatase MutT (NUDIX family)
MKHHGGQISFPGGRREKGEDLRATALREALEEVHLAPELVEVPGALDDQASVTGFIVTPFVGLVREPPPQFQRQAGEVVDLFEVPLRLLLDRGRYRMERWSPSRLPPQTPLSTIERLSARSGDFDRTSRRYAVHFFDATPHSEREIWGLTARILKDLLDRAFGFSRKR